MKKSAFLFLVWIFLFTNLTLNAQLSGPVRISNDNTTMFSPSTVVSADVDNDGDIDLVTRGSYSKTIVWYENLDGEGTMSEPKVIFNSESFSIWHVYMLDIDGDGVLDLISGYVNNLFWMKNTIGATATFSDPVYLPQATIYDIYELELIDLNGDGIQDLVVVGSGNEVGWYEGKDGKGVFRPYEELGGEGRYEIELADYDNDGDLDIACTTHQGGFDSSLGWFENQTGDEFGSYQVIDPLIELPRDLQAVDLDGDEDTDILLGVSTNISNSHHFYWYENKLSDDEGWVKKVISDTAGFAPPVIYDIDLDGDLDLVTSQEGIRVYENINGLGDFEAGDVLAPFGGESLIHVDVNNDNIADIVSLFTTTTQNQEMGLMFFGREDQTFENPIDFLGDADRISSNNGNFMEGKDLNGDGSLELVISHNAIDRFDWQSFDNSQVKYTNPHIIDEIDAADIDYADFDGDGDLDLVVGGRQGYSDHVIWYEKLDGEANYGPGNIIYSESSSVDQVFAVDFDGDGDMDIILNKPGGDQVGIHWFENLDGQGDFSDNQMIENGYIDFIQMTDVDLDGDMDIFTYDDSPGGFYWMENLGGTFTDLLYLLGVDDVETYLYEDVDGDGWKEVIYIDENNVVTLRKNNGSVWAYSDPISFSGIDVTFSGSQLFLKDYDLDGDKDLLVSKASNYQSAFIYLFENIGGEDVFLDAIELYPLPVKTSKIAMEDFDGDRDVDVIIHSFFNRTLDFIENFLNKSVITGNAYLDANENGHFDAGELVIFPQSVVVDPNALSGFPSGSGNFGFAVNNGTYEVTCNVSSDYDFTTPATVEVEVSDNSIAQVSYGLIPTSEYVDGLISITSAPSRCGYEVPFWIDYQNTGTVAGNVVIALDLDPLTTFVSAVPMPDSIVEQTIYWSHANLPLTHSGQIELFLQMPGEESFGQELLFSGAITTTSLDGTQSDLYVSDYRPNVDCVYEPNTKMVEPAFPGHKNYTLFGDTLDYTVRFQNTGADTVSMVVIEDYLDRNLDYSTLQVIGASHPYEVTLDEPSGRLLFVFDNILLPDSISNEAGSHGFIRYQIQHLDGVPEFTYIRNQANIYFDFNPLVQTNTVENILVNNYPLFVDIQDATCFGSSDGSFNVQYEGPFIDSLQWSTGDSGYTVADLAQGEYDLTVHFINGTQLDTTLSINQPMPVAIQEPFVVPVLCYGEDDGVIEITVEGGTPDYFYEWNNSVTTPNQDDLAPGTYSLTVTDENNCKDSLMVTLEAPNEIFISIEVTEELEEMMNGAISIQASGGQPPFSFAWDFDPNETGSSLSGLSAGNYKVTITDANGCEEAETITVDQITSTHGVQDQFQFQVSPNPAKGNFNVTLDAPGLERWQINITNSLGQLIRTEKSSVQGNSVKQFDFTLEPGIYQVSLLVEEGVVLSRTVVVH